MKGKGPRSERETTITFSEDRDTASIWTSSEPMYRKLKKLGYSPTEDGERSATFNIPKKCVSIRRPVVITEERKAILRERGLRLRQNTPTLPVLPK